MYRRIRRNAQFRVAGAIGASMRQGAAPQGDGCDCCVGYRRILIVHDLNVDRDGWLEHQSDGYQGPIIERIGLADGQLCAVGRASMDRSVIGLRAFEYDAAMAIGGGHGISGLLAWHAHQCARDRFTALVGHDRIDGGLRRIGRWLRVRPTGYRRGRRLGLLWRLLWWFGSRHQCEANRAGNRKRRDCHGHAGHNRRRRRDDGGDRRCGNTQRRENRPRTKGCTDAAARETNDEECYRQFDAVSPVANDSTHSLPRPGETARRFQLIAGPE